MEFFQQPYRRAEQDRVARQHGGMAEVLSNHRLAQAICTDKNQVSALGQKVQRQSALNDVAFDLLGPGPVEVGHGLELLNLRHPQPAFQTAMSAFGGLGLRQLLQDLARRPAQFGGPRQKVIQLAGNGAQADLVQLRWQAMIRHRHRACGRVHRRSPDWGRTSSAWASGWRLRSTAGNGAERWCRRSRKATDEARGVSRSKASFTARRKAAAPYRSSSRSSCAV